jgi:hypothetical protein
VAAPSSKADPGPTGPADSAPGLPSPEADAPPTPLARISLALALIAAFAWLWVSWCGFPTELWNEVRLAPAAAFSRGLPVYPTATSGTINTWAYGPLPLVLLGPATWVSSTGLALQLASVIVLLTVALPVIAICWFWPRVAGFDLSRPERLLAVALVLGAWPRLGLQNIQADSFAVAFGLLGSLALLFHPTKAGRWIAAACAVAALACKQTAVGIAASQLLWLGLTGGRREALRQAGRCAVVGVVLLGWIVAAFGWEGPWFTMVSLPSRYPWDPEPGKRLVHFAQALSVQLAVPAAILVAARRAIWRRDSPLLLPSLAWVCALPAGLAAFLKQGGSMNSIEGFCLWLPFAVPAGLAWARRRTRPALLPPLAAATAILFVALQLGSMPNPAWRPSLERQKQADFLATNFPNAVWFPWNPLVTLLHDGRFYHDEDGFYVRLACGLPLNVAELRAGLPPAMHVVALPRNGSGWSIAPKLFPPGAQRAEFGAWTVFSWLPEGNK